MRYQSLAILAALSLSACGGSPEPVETETEATPTPIASEPSPAEAPAETENALANRIPTRFQGVWDYVEGSCDPASDMRMEVSGGEILFYESIGMVTDVEEEGDDIVVGLAMEGEGETWDQDLRLSLVGSGEAQRLETSAGDGPRMPDEYPSKRCPA